MNKHKGVSFVISSIIASIIVAIISFVYCYMIDNSFRFLVASEVGTSAQRTAIAYSDTIRGTNYTALSVTAGEPEKTLVGNVQGHNLYKAVKITEETDAGRKFKSCDVMVYVDGAASPLVSYNIRRYENTMVLYGDVGVHEDGGLTQKAASENYASREESLTRPEANKGVGSSFQPIYLTENQVKASDFIISKNPALSEKIAVWDGNSIKYQLRESVVPEMIEDAKLEGDGYIKFINGLVFAWTRHKFTDEERASHIATVQKPIPFYTLVAQPSDCTPGTDDIWYYGWVNEALSKNYDRFYTMNSNANGEVCIWWVGTTQPGYVFDSSKDETKYYTLKIQQKPHQTITVRAVGFDFVDDVVLAEGTKWTATVKADEGYNAGTLIATSGTIGSDSTLTVTDANPKPYTFTINQTTGQTIRVTTNRGIYTSSFTAYYGDTWTASISPASGYKAGTLNKTSGTVTANVSVSATGATATSTIRRIYGNNSNITYLVQNFSSNISKVVVTKSSGTTTYYRNSSTGTIQLPAGTYNLNGYDISIEFSGEKASFYLIVNYGARLYDYETVSINRYYDIYFTIENNSPKFHWQ